MVALFHSGGRLGSPYDMRKHDSWQSLRPHLSDTNREMIESLPPALGHANVTADQLRSISDEIDALERGWGLV